MNLPNINPFHSIKKSKQKLIFNKKKKNTGIKNASAYRGTQFYSNYDNLTEFFFFFTELDS